MTKRHGKASEHLHEREKAQKQVGKGVGRTARVRCENGREVVAPHHHLTAAQDRGEMGDRHGRRSQLPQVDGDRPRNTVDPNGAFRASPWAEYRPGAAHGAEAPPGGVGRYDDGGRRRTGGRTRPSVAARGRDHLLGDAHTQAGAEDEGEVERRTGAELPAGRPARVIGAEPEV